MRSLNAILQELEKIVLHPGIMLEKYLGQGKKVVGCFPIYTPAEMVHAGGMIPMGIWGGQVAPAVAGKYSPTFICSIMRSCMELGLTGKYEGLSCVLMSIVCDTFRGTSQSWRIGVKDIPIIPFIPPQNRESKAAKEYLIAEYSSVRTRLEEITGCKITDKALTKSIEVYNRHNATMREFAEVANEHLDIVTAKLRHVVMKSSHFMEKAEHTEIVQELIADLKALPVCEWKGIKVVLTGIIAEPNELLDIFTVNKIAVVGDDLAQESRQFRTDIPDGDDPMERLAEQWFLRKGCSVIFESHRYREEMLIRQLRERNADGIVVCLMKFCDIEEYEYPIIVQKIEDAGYPTLCIDIDQSTQDNEQSRTKIQSFAEMVNDGKT